MTQLDDPPAAPATRSRGRPRVKDGPGQPSRLTDVRDADQPSGYRWTGPTDIMLRTIRAGVPFVTAARAAGICDRSRRDWQDRGTQVEALIASGIPITDSEARYARFSRALQEATAVGLVALHTRAVRSPGVAHAILRARDPENYNPDDRIALTGGDGGPVRHEITTVADLFARLDEIRDRRHQVPGVSEPG